MRSQKSVRWVIVDSFCGKFEASRSDYLGPSRCGKCKHSARSKTRVGMNGTAYVECRKSEEGTR
jgi:hypothetical protein